MKKLLICLIVSAAMILSIMPTVYGNSIPDINGSYEKAVDFVVAIGIMDVSEDGNFDGDKSVTRAEFCRMDAFNIKNNVLRIGEEEFFDTYANLQSVGWICHMLFPKNLLLDEINMVVTPFVYSYIFILIVTVFLMAAYRKRIIFPLKCKRRRKWGCILQICEKHI